MTPRDATLADAAAIRDIWNHYIKTTTVTFTTDEKSEADVHHYIEARSQTAIPVLVMCEGDQVRGFAAASPFRAGPGYAQTLETSVMLAPEAGGQGGGRALMRALEARAREAEKRVLVAGISGENQTAIAFHARIGFKPVGHMPGVGHKFGRWLDLVLMQKSLQG